MSTAHRYRKRPVVIEAMQFDGENQDAVLEWINGTDPGTRPLAYYAADIHTIRIVTDIMNQFWPPQLNITISRFALPGNWIAKTTDGDLQIWTDDAFQTSHEPEEMEP